MKNLVHQCITRFQDIWTLTDFSQDELTQYARLHTFDDTRKGIVILCWMMFVILCTSALLYSYLGYDQVFVYSSIVLAILSVHISLSVRVIRETRVLLLLATTLLVIHSVTLVLLAHQSGDFNIALFISVLLLFLLMPLVPWGLREALIIILLIYGVFTSSALSVEGRFDQETLWILQFVMLGASLATLIVISRNIVIRRNDIQARYELEQAHDKMLSLSLKDPLTGTWNRRFLEKNFDSIMEQFLKQDQPLYFAIVDINDFKIINDLMGHDFGDLVLKQFAKHCYQYFTDKQYLVRIGGDEFAIMMAADEPQALLGKVSDALRSDPQLKSEDANIRVSLSIGLVELPRDNSTELKAIYRRADQTMYRAKLKKLEAQHTSQIEITVLGS